MNGLGCCFLGAERIVFSITNCPAVHCIQAKKPGMPLPSGLKISFCFHNNERKYRR